MEHIPSFNALIQKSIIDNLPCHTYLRRYCRAHPA